MYAACSAFQDNVNWLCLKHFSCNAGIRKQLKLFMVSSWLMRVQLDWDKFVADIPRILLFIYLNMSCCFTWMCTPNSEAHEAYFRDVTLQQSILYSVELRKQQQLVWNRTWIGRKQYYLYYIVTGDEKWIHYDNPKRKKTCGKPAMHQHHPQNQITMVRSFFSVFGGISRV